ncbi:enoyl-CoA hydratase/isomerase family protein [Ochrobactrum sp. CM-21-5]|nr:3-hydroxyacyl-CoA dehydrogenase NAD-binding domain-containing protein [Ochrobactrum sp. CM-21-5]MBC2885181.1 enoyl-CoA hydratase/isomerase family protein [Ochrobactrum sp. CM-21-5]
MTGTAFTFSASVGGHINADVLAVTIDNPPVNATSADVRSGLAAALDFAERTDAIRAIIITGAGKIFIGGADIREFGKPAVEPSLPTLISSIEDASKPVVVALNGAALGGGLEVALAAHGRISTQSAAFALPEVKLGIVPGAGGTQRLPRLIGALPALDMIANGRSIGVDEALAAGLIDRIGNSDLMAEAVDLAKSLTGVPLRRTSALPVTPPDTKIFDQAVIKTVKKARGATAPREAARLVELSFLYPFEDGVAEERAAFLRLRDSAEAAALRHLFFAERAAGKVDGLDARPRALSVIGIAGTGLMGSGIAAACLAAGYTVVGYEQTAEAAKAGHMRIADLVKKPVATGKLSMETAEAQIRKLFTTSDMSRLAHADLVIEAVFDDLEIKSSLFRQLDACLPPETILATNTSYLNPDQLAAVTSRPDRVLGLHFFSPANIMRLVEVVHCAETSDETLATGIALARMLKKLPIITGVCEGFVGNRIFSAYRAEAEAILTEGAYPADVDRAMEAYGFPMGLFAVNDMVGLEIAWARRKREAAARDPNAPYFDVADKLCEAGRFGRKVGCGWHIYQDGVREIDPEVHALIDDYRVRHGITPRHFSDSDIMQRLLGTMAREGKALLDTGVVQRADDIDLVLVNGYGFPAIKGGPMFVARNQAV